MRIIGSIFVLVVSFLPGTITAAALDAGPQVGDAYEITRSSEMSMQSDDGSSSGSSRDADMLIERVVAVRAAGLELEYDLPGNATARDRADNWQLPARILRTSEGELKLLNTPELETRIAAWLKRGKIARPLAAAGYLPGTRSASSVTRNPCSRRYEPSTCG